MELKALVEIHNQEEEQENKILQIQEDNADLRTALICTVIANAFRGPKQRPFKVSEFLPKKKTEQTPQTPEQMIEQIKIWNATLGGK